MPSPLPITRFSTLSLSAAVALLTVAASCEDKSSNSSSTVTTDTSTSVVSRTSGHQYGPPTGKIRIANLLEINGKPSGPLDFYDVRKPDSLTKPLISHLKYGEISDYVSPRAGDNFAGSTSWIYLFPADQQKATEPFGGNMGNGFDATDQLTIALGPSKGFSGAASIALTTIVEGGKKIEKALADSETTIQGSQALLIVRDANTDADSMPEQYLMIDGSCPHAANDGRGTGDTAAFRKVPSSATGTLLFPVAAGAHTLGIVTSPRGKGLLTCSGHAPGATTSLSVQAGHRYIVWVFGQPGDGIKVVAAPIANQ